MGPGSCDVANTTLTKVHSASLSARGKHGHAALSFHEVLPFILVRMPVEFAQAAGLYGYNRRGNIGRGEITPVDDFYTAASGYLGRLHLAGEECEGIRNWPRAFIDLFLFFSERARQIAREYKQLSAGDISERRRCHIEILCQHLLGRVVHPLCQQECFELVEAALIDDQEKLATIPSQALNGMGDTAGE